MVSPMAAASTFWLMLPRPIRRLPADLAAVLALTIVTILVVVLPGVRETPLRVVFGLPFVLFLPGYAFIAALFPEAGESPTFDEDAVDSTERHSSREGGIDGLERVALSFGTSIAIVPLLGLVLNFTPWGIRLGPILIAVSGFTILATAAGAVRRWDLPKDERFSVPYREWFAAGRSELFEPDSRTDAALNVLLVLAVLLAVASVSYAVLVPKQGEAFTEFYVLTENETGELVADGYPTEFVQGESKPLVVGIGNHEHETMDYTVVVLEQRVRIVNNSTVVDTERELGRFATTVADNETWHTEYDVTPTLVGERLRVQFLLYRGGVSGSADAETAYRELHLWVNVSRPSEAAVRAADLGSVTPPGTDIDSES